jgi:hypothetical protein
MALRTASVPQTSQLDEDVARLYQQGWPIRRVAAEFGVSYGKVRRILIKRELLRPRRPPGK